MAIATSRLLGEILVQEGLTTPDVVQRALARAQTNGERIGEALVALGAVTDDDVLRALALQQDLPYLWREEFPSSVPVLKNVSAKYLRQVRVCPINLEGTTLTVASADPLNPLITDELRQVTGLNVKIVVSPAVAITEALDRTYDGAATPLQRIVEGMEDEGGPEGDEDVNHLRDMAFEAPVVRLVNLLVENAISSEASDIHIEPFEDTLRIRYRIDGILYEQEAPPRRLQAAVTSRIKIMAEMNIAERRLPQDGRIRVTLHGQRVDIRVSTMPTVHGESIVMRLLERSSVFHPLEKLGFPSDTLKRFESLIKRPHGILLVTGPTGSGKTTTLYAALDKINAPRPEDHHRRGPRRVPAQGREPDPGEVQDRPQLRAGAAPHRPPGPRRHPGRRDPRPGDGRDRHPGLAHRPPRLLHPAHQRRPRRHHPAARHGRGAVPGRLGAGGRARPAARAAHLPGLPGARHAVPGRPRRARRQRPPERRAVPGQGLRRVPGHRVPRAARASTSCSSSTRTPAASCSAAPPPATSASTRSSAGW